MSKEDLSYSEYRRLFNGLMEDTPLGRIISIRSEKDSETIKRFGPNELKIRSDWNKFRTREMLENMSPEERMKQVLAFQNMMKQAFLKKGGK